MHVRMTASDNTGTSRSTAGGRASAGRRGERDLVRRLTEAVILQSIEDLWNPEHKRESLRFFEGEGFPLCAELAGIGYIRQFNMLRLLAHAGVKTPGRIMRKAL